MTAYVSPREFETAMAAGRRLPEAASGARRRSDGFWAAASRLVQTLLEQPRRRALIAELAALSDHELADIGLSRGTLHRVFDRDFAGGRTR